MDRPISTALLATGASGHWRLVASTCPDCGETTFGNPVSWCQHCGSERASRILLGTDGHLWTYTVVRVPPPGAHRLTEPFAPFALGLVEMEGDGVRVIAPLNIALERLAIGLPVELEVYPLYRDEAGIRVMSYRFGESTHV